jgi:SHS2 domain-containing protein
VTAEFRQDVQGSGRFAVLEHTADIGFMAEAETPALLFETAALAMLDIAADTRAVEARAQLAIDVAGEDFGALLVNFLSELLYLFDTGRFVPLRLRVEAISPTAVTARLTGESRDPARHPWKLIVKAVTYHGLEVADRGDGWTARVFLDV